MQLLDETITKRYQFTLLRCWEALSLKYRLALFHAGFSTLHDEKGCTTLKIWESAGDKVIT